MIFWRKKKSTEQDSAQEDALLHPEGEAALEPIEETPTVQDAEEVVHAVEEALETPIEDIEEVPVPEAVEEAPEIAFEEDELEEEDTEEQQGGWFSRLSSGLSKSSQKIGQGIGDLITKKKLDHETLEALEEILITADLGPELAMRLVSMLEQDRFDKEVSDEEVKEYLAEKSA